MLIISWNVAGLSTTVNRINESYGKSSSKKKPSLVLQDYFSRHNADILCIQEHKIPLSQLSCRSEPLGCSSVEGYESFWSCCVDEKKRGLNGVVTYAKKGCTLAANGSPLGSPDLDEQGRCVMTDHRKFVIFNVYVPASSGQPLSYKMKFLNALRRAMNDQRKKGKEVILVGDLNIAHAKLDKFWSDRVLFIDDIQREVANGLENGSFPKWKLDIAKTWPKVEAALKTKEIVPIQTTNSLTNRKYNKYRLMVKVDDRKIYLGPHESDPKYCAYCYNFDSWSYICSDTGESILAAEDNVACVSVVTELLLKIAGIRWDESTQRMIGNEAGASRFDPPRKWLNEIISEEGMVDTFRHYYPEAEGRYTCWCQFTNRRYENEGVRIDYTLVDQSLLKYVLKGNVESLRVCSDQEDPNSEAAAFLAATANGRFQPVSFEGGGIIEASLATLDTQFGTPHTGMIYTPPSFSDHIGVSLLLDDACFSADLTLNETDSATRKAQPHKAQKSIASFFATASAQPSNQKASSASSEQKKLNKPVPQKRQGMQSFFSAKSTNKRSSGHFIQAKRPKLTTQNKKPSVLNHFPPRK
mmetsp:Transcript_10011/g.14720  ORF Transcript_10011/g.14720 Transcript_10011/m.14720 type:complete len:583 (-) Transcript_10011:126-1874(-)